MDDKFELKENQILLKVVAEEPQFLHVEKRARRHQNAEAVDETVISVKNEVLKVVHNKKVIEISLHDFLNVRTHVEFGERFNNKMLGNNLILSQTAYKLHKNMSVDAEYAAVLQLQQETRYGKGLKMPRCQRSIPDSYKEIVGHPLTSQNLKSKLVGDPLFSYDLDEFSEQVTHGAFVMTTKSFGKILKIDTTDAEKVDGFVSYVDERDIPNKVNGNTHSGIQFDTPVFVKNG